MKLLNPHPLPNVPSLPADGQVRVLRARGRAFAFDENTLALYELNGEELPSPEPIRPNYAFSADLTVRMLVLIPTDACNLSCRYCFAKPPRKGTSMSKEVLRRALALFPPGRDMNVSFFGGEPLLEFDIVRDAVREAEAAGRARFHVTTNGTLITDETARFLAEHRFSVIVSLDGDKVTHDSARPLRCPGGSSYDLALAGLEALARVRRDGLRTVTLRATFDASAPNVLARLVHLNGLARNGFARKGLADSVSVEPACVSEGCASGLGFSRSDMGALRREYDRCAEWYVEELARDERPLFFHFSKMLSRLMTRGLAPSTCGAGKGYLTAGPDGKVYACHRTSGSCLGYVGAVDESLRARWLDNRWYACAACRACWARNLCGGVCRANSFERTGELLSPDAVSCAIKRMWMLNAMYILSECAEKGLTPRLKKVLGVKETPCCAGSGE